MRRVQSCCADIHVGAAGQHSSSLLMGGQVQQLKVAVWLMTDVALSSITVHRPLPALFIDIVHFLILTLHEKSFENDGSLQLPLFECSVSSKWGIYFSCGHLHKCFNCICASLLRSLSLQCKLEQQACLTGKDLNIMCTGFCPCATTPVTDASSDTKRGKCAPPLLILMHLDCRTYKSLFAALSSFSWVQVSQKVSYYPPVATFVFSQSHSIQCSSSGINTHQFQRLLLARSPPCGETALSIM